LQVPVAVQGTKQGSIYLNFFVLGIVVFSHTLSYETGTDTKKGYGHGRPGTSLKVLFTQAIRGFTWTLNLTLTLPLPITGHSGFYMDPDGDVDFLALDSSGVWWEVCV